MAELTVYSTLADGDLRSIDTYYNVAHDAVVADEIRATDIWVEGQNTYIAEKYYIRRAFLYFDTSALPDDCIITAATLAIYFTGVSTEPDAGHSDSLLYEGTQADTLTTSDFQFFLATLLTDDPSPWAHPTSAGFATVTLNAAGRGIINKAGLTKFCVRLSGDVNNQWPPGDNKSAFYARESGEASWPKLVITYAVPGVGRSFGFIIG